MIHVTSYKKVDYALWIFDDVFKLGVGVLKSDGLINQHTSLGVAFCRFCLVFSMENELVM